jgi:hypothetical protein
VYDLELIRRLCAQAANERDPEKSEELIALLHTVLRDNVEEVKLRVSYLARRQAASGPTAGD